MDGNIAYVCSFASLCITLFHFFHYLLLFGALPFHVMLEYALLHVLACAVKFTLFLALFAPLPQVLQGTTMQQLQQVQVAQSQATPITSAPVTMQVGEGQQVQIVQAAAQGQAQAQTAQPAGQTMQVMQQIITNTGEIQQIPVQLNTGQLQYIRLAQPVSGTQVVQGQIQTLAANTQQLSQTEVQQGQQQFNQFTDGQQLYQIQQVTMPAGQELTQPMFIQSTNQTADGQVTTQVSAD